MIGISDGSGILFASNHVFFYCVVADFNNIRARILIDNQTHIRYYSPASKGFISLGSEGAGEYTSGYWKAGVWIAGASGARGCLTARIYPGGRNKYVIPEGI